MEQEQCRLCLDYTGRAGIADDSIYIGYGTPAEIGPLCETCFNTIRSDIYDMDGCHSQSDIDKAVADAVKERTLKIADRYGCLETNDYRSLRDLLEQDHPECFTEETL